MLIRNSMEEKIIGTCLNCFEPLTIDKTSEYFVDDDELDLVKVKYKHCGTVHNYFLDGKAEFAPKVKSDYETKCAYCGGTLIWSNDSQKDDNTILTDYNCLNCESLVEIERKIEEGKE